MSIGDGDRVDWPQLDGGVATMGDAIRVRLRLLGMLRAAGAAPVAGIGGITVLASLVPAATAPPAPVLTRVV